MSAKRLTIDPQLIRQYSSKSRKRTPKKIRYRILIVCEGIAILCGAAGGGRTGLHGAGTGGVRLPQRRAAALRPRLRDDRDPLADGGGGPAESRFAADLPRLYARGAGLPCGGGF